MAEYVRFVSYLYEYQGNERKKNAGFVRYEVRAGQKRLTVSVNGVRKPDQRIPVYAFYREMDSCIGVRLGTLVLRGGRGTFQYSTYADGPGEGEPECRFEEIAGVMVMGEADTPVFCTVWDNEPFMVSSFVRCRADLVRIRMAGQGEKDASVEEAQAPSPVPDTAASTEGQQDENQAQQSPMDGEAWNQAPVPASAEQAAEHSGAEEVSPAPEEMQQSQAEDHGQEASEAAAALQAHQEETAGRENQEADDPARESRDERIPQQSYSLYRQSVWERMCKLYPKVTPFPYNWQIGALRIRPGDIGRLPKENWKIANNSFMLHGFFQYRYILLLRLPAQTEEYEERYMIGVPGIYSQMDNYLAEMFGFHEFLGSPRRGSENGSFGYWVQEVHMEQGT